MKAVVGYDHRRNDVLNISSERFAKITKAVFAEAGIKTTLLSGLIPTPLVPFSVQALGCACGVMVTASHNPAADDGYKLYWGNGCQITSPHDKLIAEEIEKSLEPWREYNVDDVEADGEVTKELTDKVREKSTRISVVYGKAQGPLTLSRLSLDRLPSVFRRHQIQPLHLHLLLHLFLFSSPQIRVHRDAWRWIAFHYPLSLRIRGRERSSCAESGQARPLVPYCLLPQPGRKGRLELGTGVFGGGRV